MNDLRSVGPISYLIFFSLLLLIFNGSIYPDRLTIKAGIWNGARTTELEKRFKTDDFIHTLGSINLDMQGNKNTSIFPLSLQYGRKMGIGELLLSARYFKANNKYRHGGINLNPDRSIVDLKHYAVNNFEYEVGYKLTLPKSPLSVTTRIGLRYYKETFDYNKITGGTSFAVTTNSPWESIARSLYVGGSLLYQINKRVGLSADFIISANFLALKGGHMNHERTTFSPVRITIEDITAQTNLNLKRWTLGASVLLIQDLKLFGGFGQETLEISYPDFSGYNLEAAPATGNIDVVYNLLNPIQIRLHMNKTFVPEESLFIWA